MASSLSSSPVLIRCQGILFDMDGILISSIGSVERSWTKWAKMRGVDPEYAIRVAHGRRSIETVARLRPDLDPEAENKIVEDLEVEDTDGVAVLPGVLELLAALPAGSWTVVTSATERLAQRCWDLRRRSTWFLRTRLREPSLRELRAVRLSRLHFLILLSRWAPPTI